MKRICLKLCMIIIATVAAFGMVSVSSAEREISVMVNNKAVKFDVPPQIINGRTMVPARAIFEAMGADVEWSGEYKSLKAKKWDNALGDYCYAVFNIGSNIMENTYNVRRTYIDTPAVIVDGRTMVPARATAEAFDYTVSWDDVNNAVNIREKNDEDRKKESEILNRYYNSDAVDMKYAIAMNMSEFSDAYGKPLKVREFTNAEGGFTRYNCIYDDIECEFFQWNDEEPWLESLTLKDTPSKTYSIYGIYTGMTADEMRLTKSYTLRLFSGAVQSENQRTYAVGEYGGYVVVNLENNIVKTIQVYLPMM